MVSVKKAAPGAPNIKVFWDIIYEVIFSVHDITNKILSRDARYIEGQRFVNLNITMREVIITSIFNFKTVWPEIKKISLGLFLNWP